MFHNNSASIEKLLEQTRRTLSNIDFEYTLEIEKLESSNADTMLKKGIAKTLRERHQQRREPYVKLIRELTVRMMHPAVEMEVAG